MKLLCVERDDRSRLKVGEIYTGIGELRCTCGRAWYFIEEFPARLRWAPWRCRNCMRLTHSEQILSLVFLQRRFVPWNPDELKVTEEEVQRLFSPQPTEKEIIAVMARLWRDVSRAYDTM